MPYASLLMPSVLLGVSAPSPAPATSGPGPSEPGSSAIVDALADLLLWIQGVWDSELFRLQDTAITVSQLVIAIVTLIIGVVAARLLARRVGGTVLPRMKVEPGPASAIQAVLFYVLLTGVAVLSLQIAGVPLTVFTIFGGALALGIGFGSQNIVNNFISGLILLIERPFVVGDLVEVNDEIGIVRKIAARATLIQDYKGITSVIPNSILLENRVSNYFAPDRTMRTVVGVGVAYGSDTRLVKRLLESLLTQHARIVDHPDNRVLFMDFGDSSLDFEMHFWIEPRDVLDRRKIESDIRFKIDDLFREHGVTIPFPQRDLHIRPGPPVQVLTRSAEGDTG